MSAIHAKRALAMLERAKKKGLASTVSLARTGSSGSYNPETSRVEGAAPPATYTGVGLKVGYKQSDIDGTVIRQGDQMLYADAVGLVRPLSGEKISVGTEIYKVEAVEVIAPGEVDVLFVIQIRGV